MIDEVFLFFAKVVTVLICIVATLAPIVIAIAFCYGFYKDFLCSFKKNKGRHGAIYGSFNFTATDDSRHGSRDDSRNITNDAPRDNSRDGSQGNIGDNLSI